MNISSLVVEQPFARITVVQASGPFANYSLVNLPIMGPGLNIACYGVGTNEMSLSIGPFQRSHKFWKPPLPDLDKTNALFAQINQSWLLLVTSLFDHPSCEETFALITTLGKKAGVLTIGVVPETENAGLLTQRAHLVDSLVIGSPKALCYPVDNLQTYFSSAKEEEDWRYPCIQHVLGTIINKWTMPDLFGTDLADLRALITPSCLAGLGVGLAVGSDWGKATQQALSRLSAQGLPFEKASGLFVYVTSRDPSFEFGSPTGGFNMILDAIRGNLGAGFDQRIALVLGFLGKPWWGLGQESLVTIIAFYQ